VRAAGSVGSERERQTLDGLLASPLKADAIILGKWWGSLIAGRWLLYLLLGVWLIGLITGGLHILALPLMAFLVCLYATFMASLGMTFAAGSKTGMRAIMWTIATALFVGGGHWFCCAFPVALVARDFGSGAESLIFLESGLTPPVVLVVCAFFGEDFRELTSGPRAAEYTGFFIMGILTYVVAAITLRFVAIVRFREACGRIDGKPRGEQFLPGRRIE